MQVGNGFKRLGQVKSGNLGNDGSGSLAKELKLPTDRVTFGQTLQPLPIMDRNALRACCGGGCCGLGNGVGQGLRLLADGEHVGTSKARGMPRKEKFSPTAPQATSGVAINLEFADDNGNKATIHFDHGRSHLSPFTPGEDAFPGSVGITYNNKNAGDLNGNKLDEAITSLYKRFREPMTAKSAQDLSQALNIAMAVRYSGTGAENVAAQHKELAAKYA